MDPSLVSLVDSQMSSNVMSEESSIHKGAGYDEAFDSGDESEDFSPLLGRETSAQSLDGKDEGYVEGSEEVGVEVGKKGSWGDGVMTMTRRMVTMTRRMMERNLMKGPQWVLKTTVPLFFLRSRPSTSFYL